MFLRFKVRQVLSHRGSAHRGMVMLSMLAIVSVLFSFQNCAEPLRLEGEEFATKADGYSFGYSVKADTLAYMSCSGRQKVFFFFFFLFSCKLCFYGCFNYGIGLSS